MEESKTNQQHPKRKEVLEASYPSENVMAGNPRVNRRFVTDATHGEVVVCLPPQQDITVSGREKLKKHRGEVAGRVSIPDKWGHEGFLMEWIDHKPFDSLLVPKGIDSARKALVADGRRWLLGGLEPREGLEG